MRTVLTVLVIFSRETCPPLAEVGVVLVELLWSSFIYRLFELQTFIPYGDNSLSQFKKFRTP